MWRGFWQAIFDPWAHVRELDSCTNYFRVQALCLAAVEKAVNEYVAEYLANAN